MVEAEATEWPRWILDIRRLLPIRSQFVLSENVRDVFLIPLEGKKRTVPLLEGLRAALDVEGYEFMLVYDRIDGLRAYPDTAEVQRRAASEFGLTVDKQTGRIVTPPLRDLIAIIKRTTNIPDNVAKSATPPPKTAFVLDYASRIPRSLSDLSEEVHEFFVACAKFSAAAVPVFGPSSGKSQYNPLIWILDKENDLPPWYLSNNHFVHSQVVSKPDHQVRKTAAASLLAEFPEYEAADPKQKSQSGEVFAALTEGMTLRELDSIQRLARDQKLPLSRLSDAVRLYKIGLPDNPWKKKHIYERIANAESYMASRVKGQQLAISKTIDILKRAVMGLTGAQASSPSLGRPRGVLFFAGPTGVGKTELAKTLAQHLFNDDRAFIRFDMSEFSAEHSDARLLGAPPGYLGHETGGELTNAIRARPFSVVLFDEIEKAHGRLLDKFLQVLEDGRLTDGQGRTVYFSEAILIFTSNLGILGEEIVEGHRQRVQKVKPGIGYSELEREVRSGIKHHFNNVLNRPELLNRFGENIVVFNFIKPEIAVEIFQGMIGNVQRRVAAEHGVRLEFGEDALPQLLEKAISDPDNGGRGIGNLLEAHLINPLARALFDMSPEGRTEVRVTGFSEHNGIRSVKLA